VSTAHHGSRPIRFAVGPDQARPVGQIDGPPDQGDRLVGFSSDHPPAAVAQAARRRRPEVTRADDRASAPQRAWGTGFAQ
jgi:hypothetical protein